MSTSAPPPHFDLKNMLDLQKNYAIDLSKMPLASTTTSSATNPIDTLKTNLNSLNTNLQGSQAASNSVIYKQKIINDILDTEKQRLDQKKTNIDTAISGQRRMVDLNHSYQKRYAAYTKIMIAIVIGLVIFIFINKLMALMSFIPEPVFYIIISIILGGILFYCYLVWIDVRRRDLTNFDELALPSPDLSGSPSSTSDSGSSTSGGTPGAADKTQYYLDCVGENCCGVDSTGKQYTFTPELGCH
jgi:ElaB/YqjD/DUF883 family membrane-anchored ribosome-binding protein